MEPKTTPARRLAEVLLKTDLSYWTRARREAGQSWQAIATELSTATDGQVAVTDQTLRNWFRDEIAESRVAS